jgi:hypothetical protein
MQFAKSYPKSLETFTFFNPEIHFLRTNAKNTIQGAEFIYIKTDPQNTRNNGRK